MTSCLNPSVAYVCGRKRAKDGVVSPNIVFSSNDAIEYWKSIVGSAWVFAIKNSEISIPCGKCAACRLRKRKDMAVRLAHEASVTAQCCFLTLTYNDDCVPHACDGKYTLVPADVQLFMKRLRRHLEYCPVRKSGVRDHVKSIRYFCVGEYGSKTHRPHYHLIIFGWSPSDKVFHSQNGRVVQYRSSQVEKLWTHGFSTVEDVSPNVAKYAARYVTKKFSSCWVPSVSQVPEFVLQSKKCGGIGAPWFDRYGVGACERGLVTYRCGDCICKATVPKYYFNRLRKVNMPIWVKCRDERLTWIKSHPVERPEEMYHDLSRKIACEMYNNKKKQESEVL